MNRPTRNAGSESPGDPHISVPVPWLLPIQLKLGPMVPFEHPAVRDRLLQKIIQGLVPPLNKAGGSSTLNVRLWWRAHGDSPCAQRVDNISHYSSLIAHPVSRGAVARLRCLGPGPDLSIALDVYGIVLQLRRLRGLRDAYLIWAKGHAGIPGKERADHLAGSAAEGPLYGLTFLSQAPGIRFNAGKGNRYSWFWPSHFKTNW